MSDLAFAHPQLPWLLLLPPLLLVGEMARRRRQAGVARPKILAAQASAATVTLTGFTAPAPSSSRATPRLWLCAGLVLAIVALARPQWGRLEEPVFDQSREILLAVDLSRSMLTPDVKPSRLERSKLLIQALLEKLDLGNAKVSLTDGFGTHADCAKSKDTDCILHFPPARRPVSVGTPI